MPSLQSATPSADNDILYPSVIPFALMHLAAFGAIWTGISWQALALCGALYVLRMFGVTAGYHRYFSHRAFATGRVFQFVLALLAQSSAQKSVLWWAAKHRHHHRYSDRAEDVHSPAQKGFFYSHVGWIFARQHEQADLSRVADLTPYPELRWLHRHETAPAIGLALLTFVIGGWQGLVIGFVWSTLLVYHATFAINSLAHVVGSRRYVTGDDSRNNFLLAIATLGEGWHNNHHAFQSSARQGFRWWEVDFSFYALRGLALCGLVSNLKAPPAGVIRNEQRLGVKVIHRTAERLAAQFDPDRIASSLQSELTATEVAALRAKLELPPADHAHHFHFHLPNREALVAEAQRLFAKTPSFDEIVDRAHQLLFKAVGQRLARV